VEARELRPGLWRWELPHPEWTPKDAEDDGWEQVVASYAVETPDAYLLIDPLAPPAGSPEAERFWSALDRDVDRRGPPAVLLTIFWHARSAAEILERYPGAAVWVHEPAADLVAERTRFTHTFRPGQELPGGATGYDAGRAYEVVFWLPSHAALVAGDVLLGAPDGATRLCPSSWTRDKTADDLRTALEPLLQLPVELLLLTHGDAIMDDAREALGQALAA
jgi:glyoxylase-like metal-dependent hydrolase (beta-lactamase superfamily II)